MKLVVEGDKYTVTVGESPFDKGTIRTDPAAKAKTMDIIGTDSPNKGKTFSRSTNSTATPCASATT